MADRRNGRVTLAPAEREMATTAFALLAAAIERGEIDPEAVVAEAAENLTYAHTHDAFQGDPEEWREVAGREFVEAAAAFGVRLEGFGHRSERW